MKTKPHRSSVGRAILMGAVSHFILAPTRETGAQYTANCPTDILSAVTSNETVSEVGRISFGAVPLI